MIEMLKIWVRDLVILVIFASIIEMLIPGGALKKYVKLVMGFFIMLAVLNPLLSFLNAEYSAFYPFNTRPNQKVQREIQKQGEQFQKQNQERAVAAFQSQIEQAMRAVILMQREVEDAKVQVQADGQGQIKAVNVRLNLATQGQTEPSAPTSSVKKIDKVEVSIGKTPEKSAPVSTVTNEAELTKVQDKITKLLTSMYSIKPEAISYEEEE